MNRPTYLKLTRDPYLKVVLRVWPHGFEFRWFRRRIAWMWGKSA
jgi:hypothetical protein